MAKRKTQLCLCINNDQYPASLEANKLYLMLPDEGDEDLDMIRIIDESGEDYLYPSGDFVILPKDLFAMLHFSPKIQRKIISAMEPL